MAGKGSPGEEIFEAIADIRDEMLPQFIRVRRSVETVEIDNLGQTVREQLERLALSSRLKPGAQVAVTAGSRGISDIVPILQEVIGHLKAIGAKPFLFPAMGSHGGATVDGQLGMLRSLGINEASIGCPIRGTMATVVLGETEAGISVVVDRIASQADGLLIVNRVKPHTSFSGKIGSGLLKVLAVGIGKAIGARTVHRWGFRIGLEQAIREIAGVVLDQLPVLGGLAIVENFYGRTAIVEAIPPERLFEREPALLEQARELMPTLPFDALDLLIVDEMGKNISGTGMDTHVIGRIMVLGQAEPRRPAISRIYVRDLTEASHGNATGIGLADIVHRRVIDKLDPRTTYVNALTGTGPEKARIPPHFDSDRAALKLCLASIGVSPPEAGIAWIENTAKLETLFVSESLLESINEHPELEPIGEPESLAFDAAGDFQDGRYL
ncbi:MAG: DUF2088 domain-containing protein [Candidatus Bipolaricaulia bacterium]